MNGVAEKSPGIDERQTSRTSPFNLMLGGVKSGYMLETPSIRRYSSHCEAVKMRPVRTISRKDRTQCSESSETNTPDTRKGEDRVRSVRRRTESGRNDLALKHVLGSNNLWQSRQPGRREAVAQDILLSGAFAQWNEMTVPVVFGKGILDTASTTKFDFPADTDALADHAVIADVTDGSDSHRFYFGRANQTEAAEIQFNRANLASLPFGFKVLAPSGGGSPGSYFTDATTFTAGS